MIILIQMVSIMLILEVFNQLHLRVELISMSASVQLGIYKLLTYFVFQQSSASQIWVLLERGNWTYRLLLTSTLIYSLEINSFLDH